MNLLSSDNSLIYKPPYLLLDAAKMDADMDLLQLQVASTDFISLYKGRAEETLSEVAPYLFIGSEFLQHRYATQGWGNAWGIVVYSSLAFEALQKHFRQFLMVKDEQGKQFYFRFYDPRVLRLFLPTCNGAQLKMFFENIHSFLMEDEDPLFALIFSLENDTLVTQRVLYQNRF